MTLQKIRVGTRASRLALLQCYQAIADIQDVSKTQYKQLLDSEFKLIVTTGDAKQGTQEAASLSKNAWIDKIEEALLDGSIDVAVHSGKDLPKDIAKGTVLIPLGKRNSPFDVFIGKKHEGKRLRFKQLGANARIGTASLRRQLFLKQQNPSCEMVEHRGNVPTRIQKLDDSNTLDGIILAAAGVNRLGLKVDYDILEHDIIVPSALQGTLVAQIRDDNKAMASLLGRVMDADTATCFELERQLSEYLGADCKSCIGIYAYIEKEQLILNVAAINPHSLEKRHFSTEILTKDLDMNAFLAQLKKDSQFVDLIKIIE